MKPGVTYHDENSATLVLHDPPALKEYVFLIGDMNNWHPTENHYMNRTPDGTHYWITLEGLEADTEYGYQFYIDGELRLADPYTHKVLDPWNDEYIPASTYPDLKDYPEQKTEGLVSILHPGRPAYEWQAGDFTPPAGEDMVVYELLVRDFTEAGDIKAVQDSLDYLQSLGVNVIELMPVNEFEGNISWGYNPALYFATDKAYGPQEAYKEFIDECHQRGIAVVLDIVLNHSFNLSPMVQMYFDEDAGAWGAPMPENPWYLTDCPHEPWCWGNTFDQESEHTRDFFRRVTQYWLTEFRIDGFRFDFTKGFTNEQTGDQGWNYDQSRIDNLKRIADEVWEVNPDAYVILEHFTANNEERELAEYGMMLWGNITHAYQEAAMGWIDDSNFESISYQQRGWDEPHLVGYMESHDEERMMFKNLNYGNNHQDDYDIRDLGTALKRAELAATFYFPIPGPKMIWQFGELGYDYSINHCPDGSIDDGCRTDPKPVRWDYYDDYRRKNLYDIYAALTNLKTSEDVFRTDDYTLHLDGEMKRIHLNHESGNVTILGNFGIRQGEIDPNFQETGTWHEYFTRDEITVNEVNDPLTLEPGEYRMYSTEPFEDHGIPLDTDQPDISPADEQVKVYPNPVTNILNIEAPEKIIEVQVIDLVGRNVRQRPSGDRQTTLELGDLRTGIYFIRIRTANAIITERIQVVR
ncbi:MAG: alpha-amylase family glycosyl hydrolase [Bacteroidales bacterium]